MAKEPWKITDSGLLPSLALPVRQLTARLARNDGARIGQSAVVSRNMHTFNPSTPEQINVLQDIDAGQVFYQRRDTGKVCHIDIFHQCGLVDQRRVAFSIKAAIEAYNFHYAFNAALFRHIGVEGVKADYVDIQTGAGGGRVTGSLNYGQKLSLRRAHHNHVHIAILLPEVHFACIFYIIMAVEQVILEANLELRCNEKITVIRGKNGGQADLSPYQDQTDSFIQNKDSWPLDNSFSKHHIMQDAAILSDQFDTVQDLQSILKSIQQDNISKSELSKRVEEYGACQTALNYLAGMGIISIHNKYVTLSQYGHYLARYLGQHLPEAESYLRQAMHSIKPVTRQPGIIKNSPIIYSGVGKCVIGPVLPAEHGGELNVTETVMAAASRMIMQKSRGFRIEETDLRRSIKKKRCKAEVFLIIDASASMNGQRILAAKFLVRHLLLATPDRIAVIIFQENKAKVQVPLTRDYNLVEKSLREVRPYGSTPMSLGLKTCLQYMDQVKTNNPLILMITDGVPTFADTSRDPIGDALAIAGDIKQQRYAFTCLGLKPHRDFLKRLADKAGGSAYMLEELEKQVLVKAVWNECRGSCI